LSRKEPEQTFDFSQLKLTNRAFSERPMQFIDTLAKQRLSDMIDLIAVETGNPQARAFWQQRQLRNLLEHAHQRSAFWRKRIGANVRAVKLADLPVLTRADVSEQFASEGALLSSRDGLGVKEHTTSGSSGRPVRFFVSDMNARYNESRTLAQYLLEGRSLAKTKTRFVHLNHSRAEALRDKMPSGFLVDQSEGWTGELAGLFTSGLQKKVFYWRPDAQKLLKEMVKEPIGYLLAAPRLLMELSQSSGWDAFLKNGIEMVLPITEALSPELRQVFAQQGIPVRSSYSSEEVGPIGFECPHNLENYHVAESNVIVEISRMGGAQVDGRMLGNILVTHLHAYATPFIRYEIGDLGVLSPRCKCGHDGPVLSHLVGRGKSLVKHGDGHLTLFHIRGAELRCILPFNEYRITQTELDRLVIEFGGNTEPDAEQAAAITTLLQAHAGPSFVIDIRTTREIDWGESAKRLAFRNALL
jgi:phenylacetate-coenzyme A ligase PaaK-like adenylate-forming protein